LRRSDAEFGEDGAACPGGCRCVNVAEDEVQVEMADLFAPRLAAGVRLKVRAGSDPERDLFGRVSAVESHGDRCRCTVRLSQQSEASNNGTPQLSGISNAELGSVEVSVREKFLVKIATQPAVLSVWLNGFLTPNESEELLAEILERLRFLRSDPLYVYIDLCEFHPSPDASLDALRRWLEELGRQHELMGVMVGKLSVGMLQFQRLARAASVGDSLVCFKEEPSALDFWYSILEQQP